MGYFPFHKQQRGSIRLRCLHVPHACRDCTPHVLDGEGSASQPDNAVLWRQAEAMGCTAGDCCWVVSCMVAATPEVRRNKAATTHAPCASTFDRLCACAPHVHRAHAPAAQAGKPNPEHGPPGRVANDGREGGKCWQGGWQMTAGRVANEHAPGPLRKRLQPPCCAVPSVHIPPSHTWQQPAAHPCQTPARLSAWPSATPLLLRAPPLAGPTLRCARVRI